MFAARLVLIVGVLAVVCPSGAAAEDDLQSVDVLAPIPLTGEAFIKADLAAATLAYERRTLIDAYQEHGRKDAAWDEQAAALLEDLAHHFASFPGAKSRRELVDRAQTLLADGCNDPLVRYCYAGLLQDEDRSKAGQEKAFRGLAESYDGLVELGYPANRRYSAAKRLYRHHKARGADSEETKAAAEVLIQETLGVMRLDDGTRRGDRKLMTLIDDTLGVLTAEELETLRNESLKLEAEHPFLVNYYGGKWHHKLAWNARGNGFARSVTEEGWRLYHEHTAAERECLEKAWRAAPDRPEVPTAMIGVAMGDSESPQQEMRLWFDRAVEAQFDYLPAYHAILYGLMPRWHGDHDLMYEFGLLCKETERYDTDVPFLFCDTLWRIGGDNQNPLGFRTLADPEVYEEANDACLQYLKQTREDGRGWLVDWWSSVRLGFLYAAERYDEAADLLDAINEEVDDDALGRFRLDAEQVIVDIRMKTSPRGGEMQDALAGDGEGSLEDRIDTLVEITGDDSLHPLVRKTLVSRLRGMQWQADYNEGETIRLRAEPDLPGWAIVGGRWEPTDGGDLKGVSKRNGVIALCQAELGTRWEVRGEWEYGKSPYRPWYAGVILCHSGVPRHSVTYHPKEGWVAAGPYRKLDDHHEPFEHEGKVVPFRIRFEEGVVDVWIGDKPAIEQKELPDWEEDNGPIQLAFGASYRWRGSEITYKNLTVTPLD